MKIQYILNFAIGPIASAAFGLITIPIMAWAFNPEDLGRMSLLQVTLSFTLLISVLGLDQAYIREFHGRENHPSLLKACFAPGFILLITLTIFSIPFYRELTQWIFGFSNPLIYSLSIACIFINYLSRFLSLILRMQERGLAFSMSEITPKAIQLILIYTIVWLGIDRNFQTLIWIIIASMLTVVSVYTWNTREEILKAIKAKISLQEIFILLKFGFPLIFSGLAYWGLTTTSTLVLRNQSSLDELGVYSITRSIAGIAALFQSIFTLVWAPTVYKWVSQGIDMSRLDKITRQALAVVSLIFAIVGSFSWLTDYVLPQHYLKVKFLVVCAIAPPLLYTLSEITCIGISITRRSILTVWITLSSLITNVLISLWLIPIHGAAGAIIANAISYLVFFIARTEVSANVWRNFPRIQLYIHTLLFSFLSIIITLNGSKIPFNPSSIWLLSIPLIFFSFKTELSEFFLLILRKK